MTRDPTPVAGDGADPAGGRPLLGEAARDRTTQTLFHQVFGTPPPDPDDDPAETTAGSLVAGHHPPAPNGALAWLAGAGEGSRSASPARLRSDGASLTGGPAESAPRPSGTTPLSDVAPWLAPDPATARPDDVPPWDSPSPAPASQPGDNRHAEAASPRSAPPDHPATDRLTTDRLATDRLAASPLPADRDADAWLRDAARRLATPDPDHTDGFAERDDGGLPTAPWNAGTRTLDDLRGVLGDPEGSLGPAAHRPSSARGEVAGLTPLDAPDHRPTGGPGGSGGPSLPPGDPRAPRADSRIARAMATMVPDPPGLLHALPVGLRLTAALVLGLGTALGTATLLWPVGPGGAGPILDALLARLTATPPGILALGGVGIGLALVLAGLLIHSVTRPLARLTDAASGLSIDAAPALLPGLGRRDRFGTLARSVQDFRLTVEEQTDLLRHQTLAAKAYLSAVLDGAPDAMVTIDERGTIVGFNPAAEDVFGHPAPKAIGRSVTVLMPGGHDADPTSGQPWFHPQDERDPHPPLRRVWAARADGSHFPAQLVVQEVTRDTGGVLFVLFLRDLTNDETRGREVERARALAEDARSAHGEMLNVLANELTAPVEAMNAAMSAPQPDLDRLDAALTLLNAMTNDIRGFANLEKGLVDLGFAPVDLEAVCERARATIAGMADDFGWSLALRFAPDAPRRLLGDEALVETVLANLLECAVQLNALDPGLHATQPGVITLAVLTSPDGPVTASGNARLRIEVGCDQKASARQSVATPSDPTAAPRRLSPAAERRLAAGGRRGRTGLILAITKRLVQMMRGSVGLDSWPGRGTLLWVELDV